MTPLSGISFIVIARNEAFGIEKCLAALSAMPLRDCQIVCVDSNSSDDTRSIMERYARACPELVEVHACVGDTNAAVARNAGMAHARKEIIQFVDGDVELELAFLAAAAEIIRSGRAAMVCGSLREIRYAEGFRETTEELEARLPVREEREVYFSGGIFMVRADIARRAGAWDERLVVNEDFDYTLRISRHARCLAIPVSMGTHHTLAANYTVRAWQHLRRGYPLNYGYVLRRHCVTNFPGVLSLFAREAIGKSGVLFLLLLCGGIAVAPRLAVPWWWGGGPAIGFVLLDFARCALRRRNWLSRLLIMYAAAPQVLMGLFVRPRDERRKA